MQIFFFKKKTRHLPDVFYLNQNPFFEQKKVWIFCIEMPSQCIKGVSNQCCNNNQLECGIPGWLVYQVKDPVEDPLYTLVLMKMQFTNRTFFLLFLGNLYRYNQSTWYTVCVPDLHVHSSSFFYFFFRKVLQKNHWLPIFREGMQIPFIGENILDPGICLSIYLEWTFVEWYGCAFRKWPVAIANYMISFFLKSKVNFEHFIINF